MSSNNLSLAQHLANGQLPMWMTGNEIKEHFRPADGDRMETWGGEHNDVERPETNEELWSRKLQESHEPDWSANEDAFWTTPAGKEPPSLVESASKEGFKNPVSLQFRGNATPSEYDGDSRPRILGGHHRIAVAAKYHPNTPLAVEHFANGHAAMRGLGERY